jgi:glucose-1-phosphate adenylyltransferase
VLERTVVMGADWFEDTPPPGLPPLGVGHGCFIRNAIIDKNARIGDGCRLFNEGNLWQGDGEGWHIRDGVIVVPRNVVLPPGTVV